MTRENYGTSTEGNRRKRKRQKKYKFNRGNGRINNIVKIIFIILLLFIIVRGVILCVSLKSQEHVSKEKYNEMLAEKEKLEQQVEYINTPEYIEQAARETLKMVMPGEMLFVFKDKSEETDNDESGN